MKDYMQYLPFLLPLAIVQIGLIVAALIHIFTHKTYRYGNRILWVVVSVCLNTIGPVLYFCFGRSDEEKDE